MAYCTPIQYPAAAMPAVLSWAADQDAWAAPGLSHPCRSRSRRSTRGALPPEVEQALWRGNDLGANAGAVISSGFPDLDAELPGGGWPCQSVAEILCPQPSVLEWRLIGPALGLVVAGDGKVVVVAPPKTPHLPGLRHNGIDEKHFIWVQGHTPAERLWCTEQLVKSGSCGALVAWLPQARPEQIRRLQVGAQACKGPVFLFRPAAAQHEASAAPLRVVAAFAPDWEIHLQLLKRRGPGHDGLIRLRSVPGGLASVLTPRLQVPSRLLASREGPFRDRAAVEPDAPLVHQVDVHAVGSAASPAGPRQRAAVR